LCLLRETADELRQELAAPTFNQPKDLNELVASFYQIDSDNLPDPLSLLRHAVDAMIASTNYVLANLHGSKKHMLMFDEGTIWSLWICELSSILGNAGLPVGVRKDVDKRKSDNRSPFVQFVAELQKVIPKHLRRHMAVTAAGEALYLDAL